MSYNIHEVGRTNFATQLITYSCCHLFVSDIAIFVLKRDVKLQLTNCCHLRVESKHSATFMHAGKLDSRVHVRGATAWTRTSTLSTVTCGKTFPRPECVRRHVPADWERPLLIEHHHPVVPATPHRTQFAMYMSPSVVSVWAALRTCNLFPAERTATGWLVAV